MRSESVSHRAGFRSAFLIAALATLVGCGGGGGGDSGPSGPPALAANAGPDQVVTQGDSVTLSAAGSTIPATTTPTYQWQFLGDNLGPAPVLSGADTATLSFFAPGTTDGGGIERTLSFRLTVTAGGVSASDDVDVEVSPVGDALSVAELATLNLGNAARVVSVSCASPGNCSAGGYYSLEGTTALNTLREAFVVSQSNGVWGAATEVPGLAALNVGTWAEVLSVSCTSAGNCSAGGFYRDDEGQQGFLVSQIDGTWGAALTMPSTALNASNNAEVRSVSCTSPGNCTAGGNYAENSSFLQAFAVTQTDGVWGDPTGFFGIFDGLDRADFASVAAVSCGSAENCSAGGAFTFIRPGPVGPGRKVYVVTQSSGVWGLPPLVVPGSVELAVSEFASLLSLSCASPGNCTAGGWYGSAVGQNQGFVVSQINGVWDDAIPLPGLQALNVFANAQVLSVSCAGPGNCSAGGYFTAPGGGQAFVASQVGGVWGNATQVPGMTGLNVGGDAQVSSLSCASPGNCTAGGFYRNGDGAQGFVVSQSNGVWGAAVPVPGLVELNSGNSAQVLSVSCAEAGACSFAGYYSNAPGPFVTSDQGFVGSVGP